MTKIWIAICLLPLASAASAQVIYEPVQHQYGTVYYGGSNPALIDAARRTCADDLAAPGLPYFYRSFGYIPLPTPVYAGIGNKVVDIPPLAVCDCGNYYHLGFTPDEARTQAYDNVPRYFRKADLLASGVEKNGVLTVPAVPPRHGSIEIKPMPSAAGPSSGAVTAPSTQPAPILIIPKKALNPGKSGLLVATR